MPQPKPSFFTTPHGTRIAYFKSAGGPLTIVFMGGLMSDMSGTKAVHLEHHCRKKGYGYVRFDYSGHGFSGGSFGEGTIGSWQQDALAVLDTLTKGRILLVGSSMGGWQVLLAALARKRRVQGLIGLAPAADFTERLLLPNLNEAQRTDLERSGRVLIPSDYGDEPYVFTKGLIEDGRSHLLLDKPIPLDIPVRLLHGMQDRDVPFETSLAIMERLTSKDAQLLLVKEADHRLSTPRDLARLTRTVDDLVERIGHVS